MAGSSSSAVYRSGCQSGNTVGRRSCTRVQDGIIGSFAFDRNGDPTRSPVTILRARRGDDEKAVDRVVTPSPTLVH